MSEFNGFTINLIPAVKADLEALVDIRIAAMRESLERIGRFDPVRARERLVSGFSPDCTKHIAINGKRIGFIVVKPDADHFVLDHFYLHPDHQKKGIGSAVLDLIFAKVDAESAVLHVSALRESAANHFYKRRGFELFDEEDWDLHYVRYPRR